MANNKTIVLKNNGDFLDGFISSVSLLNTQIYSAIVVFAELEAIREEKRVYVCMYIYNQKAEGFIFPLDSQLLQKPQRKAKPKEEEAKEK